MRTAVISREEILEASRRMLREKGWSAIHMRSVAAQCGVAVGSLYNYFSSKTELVAATVESVWEELFHMPEDLPEEERFCCCVQWLYDSMREGNRRYPGFLTLHAMGFTTGEGKVEGRRMMERIQSRLRDSLCRVLREDVQVNQSVFDSRLTPEGFVELVFSMLPPARGGGEDSGDPLRAVSPGVFYKKKKKETPHPGNRAGRLLFEMRFVRYGGRIAPPGRPPA